MTAPAPVKFVSRRDDLRLRVPPAECLPHPDCCGSCSWGRVDIDSGRLARGQYIPDGIQLLDGAYTAACGFNQPVVTPDGTIGVISGDRFFEAVPGPILDAYLPNLGLSAA